MCDVRIAVNIFIYGVVREVNIGVIEREAALMSDNGSEWQVNQILYAGDRTLLADNVVSFVSGY
jgi:hypothetical protein